MLGRHHTCCHGIILSRLEKVLYPARTNGSSHGGKESTNFRSRPYCGGINGRTEASTVNRLKSISRRYMRCPLLRLTSHYHVLSQKHKPEFLDSPSTLRCAEQLARPPAFSAVQVQRPASSTLTVAMSAHQKCPSRTKATRSASISRRSLRYHVT